MRSLIFLILLFGYNGVLCSIDISQINMNGISQLSPDLNVSNFSIDDAKKLVQEKCIKVAGKENGTEYFTEIESSAGSLADCFTNLINYTAIQSEIDEAKPRGELDAVFNKYCKKRPEAIKCFEDFNSKLVPCLEKEEQESQEVFLRILRSLLNFVCHKGGDQIALFIAEKGPECLESKKDDIQNCLNRTFHDYAPKEHIDSIDALPKLVIGAKQCEDIAELEVCVVEHLESCSEITPANIVESLFRFVKNETICKNTPTSAKHFKNTSNALFQSDLNIILIVPILATLLYTFLGKNRIN